MVSEAIAFWCAKILSSMITCLTKTAQKNKDAAFMRMFIAVRFVSEGASGPPLSDCRACRARPSDRHGLDEGRDNFVDLDLPGGARKLGDSMLLWKRNRQTASAIAALARKERMEDRVTPGAIC